MTSGKVRGRLLALVMLGGLTLGAVGCGDQQLRESNVALRKQLEQALGENADLQAQNDGLKAQNEALAGDLDRARAAAAARPAAPVAPTPTRPKPDFGEGIDVSVVGDTMTVTLPDTVLFDSGRAALKASSKRALDHIAQVLNKDYASSKIRVEGHTDNQPIVKSKNLWQDNWDLSCNRSMAVLRYLVDKGISPSRIYAAGYSFYKPVATNATAAGRTKNRRVAIVVSPR